MENRSVIIRIDDRLIHGQVLVGWGSHYPLKRLIVGNDEIAENEWERNLLLMAVPQDIDGRILSLKDTVALLNEDNDVDGLTMVLLDSPGDLQKMLSLGLKPSSAINVGGIHFQEGRREYLPYIFLDDAEVESFRKMIDHDLIFECQDVPTGTKYDLQKLIG